jgi:hypothetical protein
LQLLLVLVLQPLLKGCLLLLLLCWWLEHSVLCKDRQTTVPITLGCSSLVAAHHRSPAAVNNSVQAKIKDATCMVFGDVLGWGSQHWTTTSFSDADAGHQRQQRSTAI